MTDAEEDSKKENAQSTGGAPDDQKHHAQEPAEGRASLWAWCP